ncbi:CheR family methyltransferase [Novipirellula sp. SH528]|uniref:CheR family methyltransferase n=1 Tax=Novipirellula sp. SH528 TaxID=3454466 RepID=UPI003F9EE63B
MNDSELSDVLAAIEQRTGLSFRSDQQPAICRTLLQLMQRLNIASPNAFIKALREDPDVYQQLVNEITVAETYFFREPKQFDFIRHQVIPELRSRRGDSTILRAWSAACASGEEAYSLAILCQQEAQHLDLLGTDISPESIARARCATYRDWSFRGGAMPQVANYLVQTHTEKHDQRYQLCKQVRNHVRFQLLNLHLDDYPNRSSGLGNFDLILCRNVLIYFQRSTIDAIASRLYQCLVPGGWLITASGDPSLIHTADFETITTIYGTFYRRPMQKRAVLNKPSSAITPAVKADSKSDISRSFTPGKSPLAKSPLPKFPPAKSKPADADKPLADRGQLANESPKKSLSLIDTRLLAAARQSLIAGDYAAAIQKTADHLHHLEACVIHIRAQANRNTAAALDLCSESVAQHPLSTELHYLRARLLMDIDQIDEAARSIGRALFLDRSDVMSQFLAGSIQYRRGQWKVAYRHFETVLKLCNQRSPQALIPFSKQETAAVTAAAAESQMTKIRVLLAKTP